MRLIRIYTRVYALETTRPQTRTAGEDDRSYHGVKLSPSVYRENKQKSGGTKGVLTSQTNTRTFARLEFSLTCLHVDESDFTRK